MTQTRNLLKSVFILCLVSFGTVVIVLWQDSYRCRRCLWLHGLIHTRLDANVLAIASENGVFNVFRNRMNWSPAPTSWYAPATWTTGYSYYLVDTADRSYFRHHPRATHFYGLLGLSYDSSERHGGELQYAFVHKTWSAAMPHWMVAVGAFLYPAHQLLTWRTRKRRAKQQRCIHCGYDLRASPDRCPECGKPVEPAKKSPPAIA